jgi:hypothetical protein
MSVLTHHCTGDFGIKTVQLLTVCKTEECFEGPQISDIVDIQGREEHYRRGVQQCFEWWKHTPSVLLCKEATLKVTGMISAQLFSTAFTGTFQELNWHTY